MNMTIVKGKGCFSSTHNIDTTSNCVGNCKYCYGSYLNKRNKVSIKTCDTKSLDRQWTKLKSKHKYLRIGKFTDPGYETNELTKLVDWCVNNSIKPIVVTKMPMHSIELHKAIKSVGGVYHITLGYDKLEPGPVVYNWCNANRITTGKKLIADGYNIFFRLVREVTAEPDIETKELIIEHGDRILLTPLRFKGKDLLKQMGGDISQYEFYKGFYRPNTLNSSYSSLKGCLDNPKLHLCGKCMLE